MDREEILDIIKGIDQQINSEPEQEGLIGLMSLRNQYVYLLNFIGNEYVAGG
jgi:restriction endonuclease S subunit